MTNDNTTLSPRQRLIETLCGDLNAQGWDQPNKLYVVRGNADDEWLEFVANFSGAPEDAIPDLIHDVALPLSGILVATEGWAYPRDLAASFPTDAALRAFWRLNPPSEHPQRVEIRHLLLVSEDGSVLALTNRRDAESSKDWASLDASDDGPSGDALVDTARALLGLNEPLLEDLRQNTYNNGPDLEPSLAEGLELLNRIKTITDTIAQAQSGAISQEEATLRLFRSVPHEMRLQMVAEMPEQIKEVMRKLLPPGEAAGYGL